MRPVPPDDLLIAGFLIIKYARKGKRIPAGQMTGRMPAPVRTLHGAP